MWWFLINHCITVSCVCSFLIFKSLTYIFGQSWVSLYQASACPVLPAPSPDPSGMPRPPEPIPAGTVTLKYFPHQMPPIPHSLLLLLMSSACVLFLLSPNTSHSDMISSKYVSLYNSACIFFLLNPYLPSNCVPDVSVTCVSYVVPMSCICTYLTWYLLFR